NELSTEIDIQGLQLAAQQPQLPAVRRTRRPAAAHLPRLRARPALAAHRLSGVRGAPGRAGPDLRPMPAPHTQLPACRGALALRLSGGHPDHPLQAPGQLAVRPTAGRTAGPTPARCPSEWPAAPRAAATGTAGAQTPAPARLQPGGAAGPLAGSQPAHSLERGLAAAPPRNRRPAGAGCPGPPTQPAPGLCP